MLSVSTEGSAVVMTVAGQVTMMDVVALRNEIARLVEETDARQVVVDVTDAQHLGARGLAALVDEKMLLMRHGGDLHFVLGGADAEGLGRLFHLHPSVAAALQGLPTAGGNGRA